MPNQQSINWSHKTLPKAGHLFHQTKPLHKKRTLNTSAPKRMFHHSCTSCHLNNIYKHHLTKSFDRISVRRNKLSFEFLIESNALLLSLAKNCVKRDLKISTHSLTFCDATFSFCEPKLEVFQKMPTWNNRRYWAWRTWWWHILTMEFSLARYIH